MTRWMKTAVLGAVTTSLLLLASIALAATYSVPGNFSTIQEAINAAADGDVILVDRGIYYENLSFDYKSITLKSVSGATQTVIDGGKKGPVLNFVSMLTQSEVGVNYPCSSVVDGFTIQNGVGKADGNWGNISQGAAGGINAVGTVHPTINNCIITNNTGDNFGGALSAYTPGLAHYVSIIVNNSTITNNSANYGGAAWAYMNAGVHFYNCNVLNNKAVNAGGGFYTGYLGTVRATASYVSGNSANMGGAAFSASYNGGMAFMNCVVDLNSADTAGGAFYISSGMIGGSHNTITRNSAPVGGSIYKAGGYMSYLTNSIVYGNSSLPYLPDASYSGSIYGCLIEGGAPGVPDLSVDPNGIIDADPKFVNAQGRNYRLAAGSPAIDRVSSFVEGVDIVGTARPQGLGYDIGAYEYVESVPPTSSAVYTGTVNANGIYTSTVSITITGEDVSGIREIHYVINGVETVVPGASAAVQLSATGTYAFSYFAVDNYGNAGPKDSATIVIDMTPPSVSSTSPAKSATNVSTSTSVVITFNENIAQGSNYTGITLKKGTSTVSSTKTISGTKLTIKPSSSLSSGTTYTVTVPAGAVMDAVGNTNAAYSFSFKTR